MKDIKTTATVEVLASAPLANFEEGKPSFEVLYKGTQSLKFGNEIIEEQVQAKCKSFVNLPKGVHRVEIRVFNLDYGKVAYHILDQLKNTGQKVDEGKK